MSAVIGGATMLEALTIKNFKSSNFFSPLMIQELAGEVEF